jgi:hypothetical protein
VNEGILMPVILIEIAGVVPVALFMPFAYNRFHKAIDKVKTIKRFFISYNFSFLISFLIAMLFTYLFEESYYFKADLRVFLIIFAIVTSILTPALSIMICQIIFMKKNLKSNTEVL